MPDKPPAPRLMPPKMAECELVGFDRAILVIGIVVTALLALIVWQS